MNIQFAVTEDEQIYLLEVNPRASRTIPFVSKATGIPWAQVATQVMLGAKFSDLGIVEKEFPSHYSVKECVFPFSKFKNVDTILGPEMKSTGEAIYFIKDLFDPYFRQLYKDKSMFLSR